MRLITAASHWIPVCSVEELNRHDLRPGEKGYSILVEWFGVSFGFSLSWREK